MSPENDECAGASARDAALRSPASVGRPQLCLARALRRAPATTGPLCGQASRGTAAKLRVHAEAIGRPDARRR